MFFHTAGIEVAIWIPPLVAFIISFFASMGGISGAFLLLPFQMSFLNYTNPSVSATNQLYNIVAIPSGVYRFWKEGRMVWPLTWIVILGTLPGVFIGAFIRINYLPDPKNFKIFAGAILLYIGMKLVRDILKNKKIKDTATPSLNNKPNESLAVTVTEFNLKRLCYTFMEQNYSVSFFAVFSLSFVVGILGGIYGIGGGAILSPFFVTFFGLHVYTIAGATLMGTFITSIAGVAFYQFLAPFYPDLSIAPDWLLGCLFGFGGMVGMYCGARFQKFVPAKIIKWMLAGVIVFTGLKYILNFFI